jgi:uroporphyrinogen decarboxylase
MTAAAKTELTPRERFRLAVTHRQPDRPPIQVYLTPEMQTMLADHFQRHTGSRDVLAALDCDFRYFCNPYDVRAYRGPRPSPPSGCDWADIWGVGYRVVRNQFGSYSEATHLALAGIETMDQVRSYPWPKAEYFDLSGAAEACRGARPFVAVLGGAGVLDIVNGVGSRGRGMERVLCDIMSGDEVGLAIIDRAVDFYYDYSRRALEACRGEADVLHIGEDCGTQLGPLFPPGVFREFFVPRIKRFVDLAHAHGAVCMFHSCGSVRELYPIFIEMGVEVHDSAQPEPAGMEPEALKRDFGDRLAWCGFVSTQKTLPHGSPDDCRAEAARRIEVLGAGGGYFFGPAHNIQPDVPLANVLAMYEAATGKDLGSGLGPQDRARPGTIDKNSRKSGGKGVQP